MIFFIHASEGGVANAATAVLSYSREWPCIFFPNEFSAVIFDWDTVFGIRFPYACTLRIIAVFLGSLALCLPTVEEA